MHDALCTCVNTCVNTCALIHTTPVAPLFTHTHMHTHMHAHTHTHTHTHTTYFQAQAQEQYVSWLENRLLAVLHTCVAQRAEMETLRNAPDVAVMAYKHVSSLLLRSLASQCTSMATVFTDVLDISRASVAACQAVTQAQHTADAVTNQQKCIHMNTQDAERIARFLRCGKGRRRAPSD